MENQLSMLPQPATRSAGATIKPLQDLSDSDGNARSIMAPLGTTSNGLKRQGSNLPEPAQKRKTLAERAGEPISKPSGITRPPSAASQYTHPNPSTYRSSSNASTLSRSNSAVSRNTSNSSYTGSLTSGIRPPTISSTTSTARPKSSYASHKAFGAGARPISSIANNQPSHETQQKSKKPSLSNLHGPRYLDPFPQTILPTPARATSMLDLREAGPRRIPSVVIQMRNKHRDISISTQLGRLRLAEADTSMAPPPATPRRSKSPSKIPRASPAPDVTPTRAFPQTPRLRHKPKINGFLTPYSTIESFDPDIPYQDWKRMFDDSKQMFEDAVQKVTSAREETNTFKEQLSQVEREKSTQVESMILLKTENQNLQYRIQSLERTNADLKHDHERRLDELKREHRSTIESIRCDQRAEIETLKSDRKSELREMKDRHQQEIEQERGQKLDALNQVSTQEALEKQRHQLDLDRKDQELVTARSEAQRIQTDLDRERQVSNDLRASLKNAGENTSSMELARQGLQAKIAFLESDSKSQSESYAAMEKRMTEAISKADRIEEKLRREETVRRKLHNQVQELKGNIRVFCRVRPTLSTEEELSKMKFPNQDEEATDIEVKGMDEKNSLGKDVTKTHPFTFDKVFNPEQSNTDVFEEIQHLIQSALDGFNVCIFAYGQTGSGKTYTMSSDDGMIPKALRMIYENSRELAERGWTYQMEGAFVEVYNEEIRDLLGDESYKKHEVHHDLQNNETTITNCTTLKLDSKEQVESILSQAMARRSVAATKSNEHSSRSHSVFILKLVGKNSITGEESKGTLNLVDLAGSERIKNAETSGQRLKETQSINKSLSCLADVIGALGQSPATFDGRSSIVGNKDSASTAHIPYRNSKLTYLLQLSLGGNCKTLMFVMVAPEKKCLNETITSLRFAEKVSRTRVGVAKRVK